MDTIKLTRQLGAAIQQDPAYINYNEAKIANDQDDELQKMIGEFNLLRASLSNELSKSDEEKSESKVESLNEQMREVYAKIMANPHMDEFNQAKAGIDLLMGNVNDILMLCLQGEDPETCEPNKSDCSGGCSSCSGCH